MLEGGGGLNLQHCCQVYNVALKIVSCNMPLPTMAATKLCLKFMSCKMILRIGIKNRLV